MLYKLIFNFFLLRNATISAIIFTIILAKTTVMSMLAYIIILHTMSENDT